MGIGVILLLLLLLLYYYLVLIALLALLARGAIGVLVAHLASSAQVVGIHGYKGIGLF
jgi:hypothetical protein